MNEKRVRVLASILGLMIAGCATSHLATAPAQAAVAPEPPSHMCPDSIALEAPLEADYGPRIQARHWWSALTPSEFTFVPTNSIEEAFRQKVELAGGTVELLGLEERTHPVSDGGAALVLARPVSGGYCIINTWATWQSSEVDVSLAGSWVSPDKRLAILLLKLELGRSAGGEETRWVVLGADGGRAWIALGKPPEHQLIAPSVALVPKKNQLFLEVKLDYVNRLRLGADGHFVVAGAGR